MFKISGPMVTFPPTFRASASQTYLADLVVAAIILNKTISRPIKWPRPIWAGMATEGYLPHPTNHQPFSHRRLPWHFKTSRISSPNHPRLHLGKKYYLHFWWIWTKSRIKAIYIRLADSTCLLVEVFLSELIHVEVSSKMY